MACNPIEILFPTCDGIAPLSGLAALRAYPVFALSDAQQVTVNGDGEGVTFVWDASSLATDNGITTIRPNSLTPLQAGRWVLQFSNVYLPQNSLAGDTGASLIGWRRDATGAVLRTLSDKLAEQVSLRDFGIVGNGTTDDTLAMQAVAAFVNSTARGCAVHMGRAIVKITADIVFTKPVSLIGEGSYTSAIICYGNSRIICDGNRTDQPPFSIEKLSILTDGIHTSSPLSVNYSPHVDGALTPTLTMRDVVIAGKDRLSGFQTGIELVDCPWPRLDNVVIIGDEGRGSAAVSGTAIKYTGRDGSGTFSRVRGYSVADFIYCEGEMEGVIFDGCEAVSVQRGISCKDTSGGAQPYFVFRNNHINAEEGAIVLVGIDKFDIDESNLLFAQVARQQAAAFIAVDITPTLATGPTDQLVLSGTCRPQVNGDGGYAPVKTGTRVRGAAVSLEDYTISGRYQGLSVGVQLDSGSNGARVTDDISFRNTVTPILNSGNNIIQGGGYAYAVATLPNGSATTLLGGTRLFVADAAGGAAFGSIAIGGGTTPAPVYYDGANWRIG